MIPPNPRRKKVRGGSIRGFAGQGFANPHTVSYVGHFFAILKLYSGNIAFCHNSAVWGFPNRCLGTPGYCHREPTFGEDWGESLSGASLFS